MLGTIIKVRLNSPSALKLTNCLICQQQSRPSIELIMTETFIVGGFLLVTVEGAWIRSPRIDEAWALCRAGKIFRIKSLESRGERYLTYRK